VHGTEGGTVGGYYQYDSEINQGTISADTAGQTITIVNGFTNQGTVSAPAGGNLAGTFSFTLYPQAATAREPRCTPRPSRSQEPHRSQ